jgi:hypothetical protein
VIISDSGDVLATDAQVKEINALIKKYPDSCSICHEVYDEDDVTYTVLGMTGKVKYRSPRDAVPEC